MLAPYRGLVTRAYQKALLKLDIDSDLRRALKSHERVPKFIDNLSEEFTKLASSRLKIGKQLPAEKHLEAIVVDFTTVFVQGIQNQAEKRYESDIQKMLRKAEEDNRRDLEQTIDGNASGDYADVLDEGGVTSLDSRDVYGKEEKNRSTAS